MFETALKTFNERRQYNLQIARTLHCLANTQNKLGRLEQSFRTMAQYNNVMRQLSALHERKLVYGDLRELIRNNWD
jgi:hypothetical protein